MKKADRIARAKAENAKLLHRLGYGTAKKETKAERSAKWRQSYVQDLNRDTEPDRKVAPCSNGFGDQVTKKRSVLELPPNATPEEIAAWEEANRKAKCVAPAYNKGGYQYISNAADAETAGRKV